MIVNGHEVKITGDAGQRIMSRTTDGVRTWTGVRWSKRCVAVTADTGIDRVENALGKLLRRRRRKGSTLVLGCGVTVTLPERTFDNAVLCGDGGIRQ